MAQEACDTIEVILDDVEKECQYKLFLSTEDYLRSQTDENFANSLLFHARCNRNTSITSLVNETEGNKNNPVPDSFETENLAEDEINGNKKLINIWSYNQTKDLIYSMGNHISDLNHPRKRKHVFENVANDLISLGYTVTSIMAQNKWKSLVRSYTKVKDNKNRTGAGPARFLFYDLLDNILGDKPSNSCTHALNSIENTDPAPLDSEPINVETQPIPSPSTPPCQVIADVTRKRKFNDKSLQKDYIEMKKEEYARRQKRHEEKIEIEKQKIVLLEQYLKPK